MPSPDVRQGQSSVDERYRALLETGRTLAGTLSSSDLFAAIHRETASVLEASGFYISLYDQGRDLATIVYYADRGEVKRVDLSYRGSDSEVIRTQTAALVNDGLDDRSLMVLGESDAEITCSAVSAPLIHKGRVLGAISAQSYEPDAYSEEDLALLQGIADIAAVALDNAEQFDELEKRRREAEQIEQIGRALTSELDPKEVLQKVIAAALEVLDVDGASVWLCEGPTHTLGRVAESGGEIRLPVGLSWDLSGDLSERLVEERRPIVVNDLASSGLIPEHLKGHLEAGSGLGVPLIVSNQVAGVLTAGSRSPRHFGEGDVAVLQRIASQASVALENARLHANLQALSLTDPLTGLPNRRRLQIHLDKEVAAARRGRNLVLVVFDLDDFKRYNDTLGHLVGDDILRAFAQILDDENRSMNLVARYGGDEFVSVLSESHMDGARLYVQRVSDRVAKDGIMGEYGVQVSMGLAEFDRASMKSMEDVIQAADMDMYATKAQRSEQSRRTAST
jgi:diguanylate cyclase (GGDEF)-like protein